MLLAGSRQPVVLRECADGMFSFKGMAYVHGVMHGELNVREDAAKDCGKVDPLGKFVSVS